MSTRYPSRILSSKPCPHGRTGCGRRRFCFTMCCSPVSVSRSLCRWPHSTVSLARWNFARPSCFCGTSCVTLRGSSLPSTAVVYTPATCFATSCWGWGCVTLRGVTGSASVSGYPVFNCSFAPVGHPNLCHASVELVILRPPQRPVRLRRLRTFQRG